MDRASDLAFALTIGQDQSPTVARLMPGEVAEFAPALDQWLRPGAAISAKDDLPLLVGEGAESLRMVAREDGSILSHAALHVWTCRIRTDFWKVGVIGAVATDPRARGRGLASQLVRALQDHAAATSIDVLVLWTDREAFYERLGFLRAGVELIATLPDRLELPTTASRVRAARPADAAAIAALHDAEPSATLRSPAVWEAFMNLPATRFFVLESENGAIPAYGVAGKGHDLQGCLHEWAGDPFLLPELVLGIAARPKIDLRHVMAAPWHLDALRALEPLGATLVEGALGMLFLPDPAKICKKLARSDTDRFAASDPGQLLRRLYLPGLDAM